MKQHAKQNFLLKAYLKQICYYKIESRLSNGLNIKINRDKMTNTPH